MVGCGYNIVIQKYMFMGGYVFGVHVFQDYMFMRACLKKSYLCTKSCLMGGHVLVECMT